VADCEVRVRTFEGQNYAFYKTRKKPAARTSNIQQTAAPVSGKKPPPSRCALSRWRDKEMMKKFIIVTTILFSLVAVVWISDVVSDRMNKIVILKPIRLLGRTKGVKAPHLTRTAARKGSDLLNVEL
jgi:hypothetical protein